MIVAIEGIDGAGKNSQVELLLHWFEKNMRSKFTSIRKHDFPHYETTAGGVVGRILRGETAIVTEHNIAMGGEVGRPLLESYASRWSRDKAIIIQSVMIADRLEWMSLLVEYAQSPDNLLLLDRYKMSGIAYGAAEGIEANWTRQIQSCLPDADLNVLLDISVQESNRRRPERRDLNERDHDKLHRARGYYLREFDQMAASDAESCLVVTGDRDRDSITVQIVDAILRKMTLIEADQTMVRELETF